MEKDGKKSKKIIIVDDHAVVREGLKQILSIEDDLSVCGEACDVNEAVSLVAKKKPDLVIIDISLDGGGNGIDLVKALKERFYSVRSLVLSMHDETVYAERAIRAGARGYVMKKSAYRDIVDAVRKVLNGDLYLSSDVSMRIIDRIFHGKSTDVFSPLDSLTDRELEIFRLIGQGKSTAETAKLSNVTINTVQSHKRHIKEKLCFKTASELTRSAVQWVENQERGVS